MVDLKMPIMDGMELSKYIKNINSQTKIIIISAFDDSKYLYDSIELGAYRYLKKPVNITDFSEVIYSCVKSIKRERDS